ncbi:hypothetical protein V5O48_016098 [Marasmius crinis-equi]|uniref:Uncharacterized protein n=1 Tax=Marasmius crinis-equi TaxID=585013 RepID=A0ABR3ESQ2_9AGAR
MVAKLGREQNVSPDALAPLTLLVDEYASANTHFVAHLAEFAPPLHSTLLSGIALPVFIRKKDSVTNDLLSTGFGGITLRAMKFNRTKSTNYTDDDQVSNKIVDVTHKEHVLQLIKKLEDMPPRQLNKAQITGATRGTRQLLQNLDFWEKIMGVADKDPKSFRIYDDPTKDDGASMEFLFSLTIGVGHIIFRAEELVWQRRNTSTTILGSMAQRLLGDIFECPDFQVLENQTAGYTYLAHFLPEGSLPEEDAHLSPRPDSFVLFGGLVVVFLEIISDPSKTDRTRMLLQAASYSKLLRVKGLVDKATDETLTVAMYLDKRMMMEVHLLTTMGGTGSVEDMEVCLKRKEFWLAGGRDIEEFEGEDGEMVKRRTPSEVYQFLKFLWDLEKLFREEIYKDKGELIQEVVREVRGLSTMLKNAKDLKSSSSVSKTRTRSLTSEASVTNTESSGERAKSTGSSRRKSQIPQQPVHSAPPEPLRRNPSRKQSSKPPPTVPEAGESGEEETGEEDDPKDKDYPGKV